MKRLLILPILLYFIICCKKEADLYLEILQTPINFQSKGGELPLAISSNLDWKVLLSGVTWVNVNPLTGLNDGNININVTENHTVNPRSMTLSITAGSIIRTITISQEGAVPTLSLDKYSENVNALTGSLNVQVITNGTAWTTGDVPSWITLKTTSDQSQGNITVYYQANPLALARTAQITITSGALTKTLIVNQAAATPVLQLNLSKIQVDFKSGNISLDLITNDAPWIITNIPEWISSNPAQGDKSSTVTFSYQSNASNEKRTAQLVFKAGNTAISLIFEQLTYLDANNGGNW